MATYSDSTIIQILKINPSKYDYKIGPHGNQK